MNHDVLDCRRTDFLDFASQILSRGSALRIRAHGWSMYPCIKDGDFAEVEPVEASAVKVGDVVFCRSGTDQFVAHRVINMDPKDPHGALLTKGDWTPYVDPVVYPEQVLGRVVAIERGRKRIRFDTGSQRLIQAFWARISPRSHWLYLPATKLVRAARRVSNRIRSP